MLPIERPYIDRGDSYLYLPRDATDAQKAEARLIRDNELWSIADALAFKDLGNVASVDRDPSATIDVVVTSEWRSAARESIGSRRNWLLHHAKGPQGIRGDDWLAGYAKTASSTYGPMEIPNRRPGCGYLDARVNDKGTTILFYEEAQYNREWVGRPKVPILKFDIKGYLIEADVEYLRNHLGLGPGRAALARYATKIAEMTDKAIERYKFNNFPVAKARIYRELRTLEASWASIEKCKEFSSVKLPTWVFHEIERYRRQHTPRPAEEVIAEDLGDILSATVRGSVIQIETSSGRTITISGEAEIVGWKDAVALWPEPAGWKVISDLQNAQIGKVVRTSSGSVTIELPNLTIDLEDHSRIVIPEGADFDLSDTPLPPGPFR